MTPFETSTYLTQVRRLRMLAEKALAHFPVRARHLEFIQHGENSVFKVTAKDDRKYLLRVHRLDYHSLGGIEEELKWLEFLSDRIDADIPRPLRTKDGRRLATVSTDGIPNARPVTMCEWVDGHFMHGRVRPKHMRELGRLIAEIQTVSSKIEVKHRRYWNAESMLGPAPKWGEFDALPKVKPDVQKRIDLARARMLRELKTFARKHPDRMNLIHSDMHFGNLLRNDRGWGVIDFDDCGYGFDAYDLNAPLMSVHFALKDAKRSKEFGTYQEALIDGYTAIKSWDADDARLLENLMTVRYLIVLGWLNSRSDNPRLRSRLKSAVKRTITHLDRVE
ncbi:MAG: phosphotransferase [Bdellovibrionota bacterium]